MNYKKLGMCKFKLYGNPNSKKARVEIQAEIFDPYIKSLDDLISKCWLLMLESQIGKVSKPIQDMVIYSLMDLTFTYFKYGIPPRQVEKSSDMLHLATLEIELCFGNKLFVHAFPRDFDLNFQAEVLAGLIMFNSHTTICSLLSGESREDILYLLIYGIHKWETTGRPGVMTAFTETWDFQSINTMVEQGKELIQQRLAINSKENIASVPQINDNLIPSSNVPVIGGLAGCGAFLIAIGVIGACLPLFGYQFKLLTAASESMEIPEIYASGILIVAGLIIIVITKFMEKMA